MARELIAKEAPVIFRIVYRPQGKHVQCRLFVAKAPDRTFALCGDFAVRAEEEFEALKAAFTTYVQWVEDTSPPECITP